MNKVINNESTTKNSAAPHVLSAARSSFAYVKVVSLDDHTLFAPTKGRRGYS